MNCHFKKDMKAKSTLEKITAMAADDNKGLMMTTTVLNASTIDDVSRVTFQTSPEVTTSAGVQAAGVAGDYLCVAFFIDRKELSKYK